MSYYRINGVDLTLQPSDGKWMTRQPIALDGNGHPIYPVEREFQLSWDLMDVSELYQLQDFFDTLGVTGTVSVDLPTLKSLTYGFTTYSGCVMYEPEYDVYFEDHPTKASLLIARIRTI